MWPLLVLVCVVLSLLGWAVSAELRAHHAELRAAAAAHERDELRRCAVASLLRVHVLVSEADAGIRAYHGSLPQMVALSTSPGANRLRLAASAVSSAAELSARVAEVLGDHDGRLTKPDRS